MRKIFYSAFLAVLSLNSTAQISFIPNGDTMKTDFVDYEVTFYSSLVSHDSVDSLRVRWRIVETDFPGPNWQDYVCDIYCYTPTTRTNSFYLQPLDTFPIQHYLRMEGDTGTGRSTMCFFVEGDSANTVQCLTVHGRAVNDPSGMDEQRLGSRLGQNVPNPFRSSTTITYSLRSARGEMLVYDLTGRQIERLELHGASDQITLGGYLKAGIYFYTLWEDGRMVDSKRMEVLD